MTNRYLIVPLDYFRELSFNEKIVLSQLAYIRKASNTITVSNAYLSKALSLSVRTIIRIIVALNNYNYITIRLENNNKREIILSNEVLAVYGIPTLIISRKGNTTQISNELRQFMMMK